MDELKREIAEIVCDRCDEIAEVFTDKERILDITKDIANDIAALFPQWTRVEDGLPDTIGSYLYYGRNSDGMGEIGWCFYNSDGKWCIENKYINDIVTHWQPLPQPPKEG